MPINPFSAAETHQSLHEYTTLLALIHSNTFQFCTTCAEANTVSWQDFDIVTMHAIKTDISSYFLPIY